MRKYFFAIAVLFGLSTLANDSGMPYIEVDQLTFKKADVGTSIEFRGKEAESLFKALPNMDVMDSQHGFTATGKIKSVSIICTRAEWNDRLNKHVEIQNGPVCKIAVGKKFVQGEGDDQKWINDREPQSVKKEVKK